VGRLPLVRAQDRALRLGLTGVAALILLLIGFFFVRLLVEAWPAFDRFGVFGFTFTNDWDVSPTIGKQIFDQGYSLAAVIANEFGEAANDPTHRAALIAAGLVLFVLTLSVNLAARWFVRRVP
jgi:ABC-type phosphate transport system permease subunit